MVALGRRVGCRLVHWQPCQVLVESPAHPNIFLRLIKQTARRLGIAVGEHGVASLVVGVRLERQARRLGVELERLLAILGQLWVVAKERPVTGLDRGLLLFDAVAQIVAVGYAVAA